MDNSELRNNILKTALDFYLQQWENLTPEILQDLALYLTGLDNDSAMFNQVFKTKQQKQDYFNQKLEQLGKISKRHKEYMERQKPVKENNLTLEEFLQKYRQIAEEAY